MIAVVANFSTLANASFVVALTLMAGSLACLVREIKMSGGALEILLKAMAEGHQE